MKLKNLARKSCSVFLALALCMSLLQVPAFAADLEDGNDTVAAETENPGSDTPVTPGSDTPANEAAPVTPGSDTPANEAAPDTPDTGDAGSGNTEPDTGDAGSEVGDDVDGSGDANTDGEDDANSSTDDANEDDGSDEDDTDSTDKDDADSSNDDADADDADDSNDDADVDDGKDDAGNADEETPAEEETPDEETPDEVTYSEAAQKFLDSVKNLPDSVTEENHESVLAMVEKCTALYYDLSPEEQALVGSALIKLRNLMGAGVELENLEEEDETVATVKTAEQLEKALRKETVTTINLAANIVNAINGNFQISRSLTLNLSDYEVSIPAIKVVGMIAETPINVILNGGEKGKLGGVAVIGEGAKFTMNGGTITGSNGIGVTLESGASFVMEGGTISENQFSGVHVKNGSSFTMNNGTISKNNGYGGVCVVGGNFTMNNGTISGNNSDSGGGVTNYGGTFTMNGGTITGNTAIYNGGGVYALGGNFTMNGGTITGNTASLNGGGVANWGGSFTMNGGDISGNAATWNGGGVVNTNSETSTGTFNMKGDSTISNNTSTFGGGVANMRGTFTMENGTISNNTANASDANSNAERGGGGGVISDSTFNLSGGTITGNVSEGSGGGISVGGENHGTFTMTGGTVSDNTAQHGNGAGITIVGNASADISGGSIIGNQALPLKNLDSKNLMAAGGGIYVEKYATLKLTNVIVTQNYASSMGGGLAACPTGRVFVFGDHGAAIYDNDNGGDPNSPWGKPDVGNDYFIKAAKDIYTACRKDGETEGGALIGNIMLSGVTVKDPGKPTDEELTKMAQNLANWEGYVVMVEDPTKMDSVGKGNNGTIYGSRFVALTANPSEESKQAAMDVLGLSWSDIQKLFAVLEDAKAKAGSGSSENAVDYNVEHKDGVLIAGNVAGVGGGVANNGILNIGTEIGGISTPDDIGMTKDYVDEDNKDVKMDGGEFSFKMTGGRVKDGNNEPVTETQSTITVENNSEGRATFKFAPNPFTKPGTYVFYVTEDQAKKIDGVKVKYDGSRYEVTIKVTEVTESGKIGEADFTVNNLVISDPEIKLVAGKDGVVLEKPDDSVGGISFENTKITETDPDPDPDTNTNTDTDPDPDPDPDPTPNPKPDPKPDPKPTPDPTPDPDPEEPPIDVPDPDVPLVPADPEPPVDIIDEQPPLVDIPAEEPPLVELPDLDVPLASATPVVKTPVVKAPNPEVPLVDIPEEDVPLADVPATGDNSGLWLAMSLSACAGLVYFFLEEKKRQNEAK